MEVSLKELLEAGSHFGHQTTRWNPRMKQYIFTARDGVHIFDLAKTKEGLENAAVFAKTTTNNGGKILFVGTKRQAREIVQETAKKLGMPYMTQRWLGGTLTNWDQLKKSIDKLGEMKQTRESGGYKEFTKKEQLLIDREIAKLEKFLGGVSDLKEKPQVLFIVDAKRESSAIREAKRTNIPVICLVDTDSNPDLVDFVIPANDDALASIKLILEKIEEAVREGLEISKKEKAETSGEKKES